MRFFKRIYIEITNICNLNCTFCPKTSRKPEFMDIAIFEKILTKLDSCTGYLYFHVMGEPLLHPDISIFLDLCHKYSFKVNITTNGMFINEAKDRLLSKPALRLINFSLHCFDANTLNSAIDGYLDEIFNFVMETASSSELISCLRLWNAEKNSSISSASYFRKNHHILQKIENFFKVPYKIKEIPTVGNGIKLVDKVYLSQDSYFDWPNKEVSDLNNKGFCLGLREQVAILVDGTVVPCCLDSEGTINLGNIKETAFSDIIEGKRAMNLHSGFSKRKVVERLCRKCSYRKRFD